VGNVSLANEMGETPLHYAAASYSLEVVLSLIALGADRSALSLAGWVLRISNRPKLNLILLVCQGR